MIAQGAVALKTEDRRHASFHQPEDREPGRVAELRSAAGFGGAGLPKLFVAPEVTGSEHPEAPVRPHVFCDAESLPQAAEDAHARDHDRILDEPLIIACAL
uniref:Uncharacterized protein n=1 Tax=Steinernema glaseri TaxID=37863 RepID=A0A1I7ZJN4_9BILA